MQSIGGVPGNAVGNPGAGVGLEVSIQVELINLFSIERHSEVSHLAILGKGYAGGFHLFLFALGGTVLRTVLVLVLKNVVVVSLRAFAGIERQGEVHIKSGLGEADVMNGHGVHGAIPAHALQSKLFAAHGTPAAAGLADPKRAVRTEHTANAAGLQG